MKKIISTLACISLLLVSCNEDDRMIAQTSSPAEVSGLYPQPPSLWLGGDQPYYSSGYTGDVMPYFDNGKFHLFFLHDAKNKPAGEGFHDIHEFETNDLVHFDYTGRMIPYGLQNKADFAVGTGSVVKVGSEYYFYYTGHNGNSAWTGAHPRESVLLAKSTDLSKWTKVDNFIITAPAGYNNFEFRDPHVFHNDEDGKYWMLVSTQASPNNRAVILKFTSEDPASGSWTPAGPLYTSGAAENYLMMECADIFQMGQTWYLVFSENWSNAKGTHYRMASSPDGPWSKPVNDMLDGEYFYAGKTATDGNKRYLFAWTARRSGETDAGNKEYAGNLVTHELIQNTDGTLGVKVPETVASGFGQATTPSAVTKLGAVNENASAFELDGTASPAVVLFPELGKTNHIHTSITLNEAAADAGFVFGAQDMSAGYYKVIFEPQNGRIAGYTQAGGNTSEVTRVPFTFEAGHTYQIDIVTDNSVCVVYIDGKAALSNRIYTLRGQNWGFMAQNATATFGVPQIRVH